MSNMGWGPPGSGASTWGQPPPQVAWGQSANVPYGGYRRGRIQFAGFWARWCGSVIDGLLVSLILTLVDIGCLLAGVWLARHTATTDTVRRGAYIYERTTPTIGFLWFFIGVAVLLTVVIVWRLIPGRMARKGATPGMQAMGLEIVTARHFTMITGWQAFARMWLAFLIPFVLSVPAFVVLAAGGVMGSDSRSGAFSASWTWGAAVGLAYCLTLVSQLWNVVDRRRQTLYDKMTGTVVIYSRE